MSRLTSLLFAGAASVALIGCATEDQASVESSSRYESIPTPDDCVKIEGADIGRKGVTVTLGDLTVEFTAWVEKDGEPNEYVGFTLSGSAVFLIKAGNNADYLFDGSGTSWINPYGTGGSDVKGISNIQICEIEPPNPPQECGGYDNPCPQPPEECGSYDNPCPHPEECGWEGHPCEPAPEVCGSYDNPCPVSHETAELWN